MPIQATNLETQKRESYISQCMRPDSLFPLRHHHSRFNAVRASVINKFEKVSCIIVTTIPCTANVNWATRLHQREMDNESLTRFGIDVVQQSACLFTLVVFSALLTQKYKPRILAFDAQQLDKLN